MIDYAASYRTLRSTRPDAPDRFEKAIEWVYRTTLMASDIAVDVGAHSGKHTIPLAHCVGGDGLVFAFEPIFEKIGMLAHKVQVSQLGNVHFFNICLADRFSLVEFTYLPTDPGKSSISIRKSLAESEIRKIVSLVVAAPLDLIIQDEKLRERVKFVKIDVEGAELHVLRGASSVIASGSPVIHTELGPESLRAFDTNPMEIFDFFAQRDYDILDILGNRLHDKDEFRASVSASGVYDYISIPRSAGSASMFELGLKEYWSS